MALVEILLFAVLAALGLALYVLWQIRVTLAAETGGVETDQLTAAVSQTLSDLQFRESVGRIEDHAAELAQLHGDIEGMLRTPRERGEFGEVQLELILEDHLPPDRYGVREQVVDGAIPDAHVDSSAGVICIDSKFPLENYERALAADDDEERERYERQFASDVESQLEKIAADYVRPAAGTTDFAFAFVPSEAVYYHLLTEEYDMLRSFTKRGVQVVSPLTLGHKLELIQADLHAARLSAEAERVQQRLTDLAAAFEDVEDEWRTLHRHVSNAKGKADDVDRAYERLRDQFDRVDRSHPVEPERGRTE
ncbi:MAG: DNA recombination protein RmuC [Haloarculaceae archaeon]